PGALTRRRARARRARHIRPVSSHKVRPLFAFVVCRSPLEGASMRHSVRIAALAAALSLCGVATARAQADDHKPGGLNKVAHNISNTSKKAGRDTKAEIKRDAGKTHQVLKKAGNDTKTVLKKTTGIKGSQSKDPGGLN